MNDQLHGFIEDMPNDDYHRAKGVSKTGLDKIDRSPAHYRWPKKRSSTRNMEIGTAIHTAILEPERFAIDYKVAEADKRTEKAYKEIAKENGGECTLTTPESIGVIGMQKSVQANVAASHILNMPGKPELSAFVTDPETGIQIRARYDWITDNGIVLDVKKTQDLRKFNRSVMDYRYHVQDAMYSHIYELLTGEKLQAFLFLAVEEDSPHSSKVFELDETAKEIGFHYYRKNLRTYAECINSGEWPHADLGDEMLELPNWALSQYENDLEVKL